MGKFKEFIIESEKADTTVELHLKEDSEVQLGLIDYPEDKEELDCSMEEDRCSEVL